MYKITNQKYLKFAEILLFLTAIGALYWYFGASQQLRAYYSHEQKQVRQNQQLLRPMYAQLQRELIKSRLDLPFTLDNLELIIQVAMLHSQMGQGVLPDNVRELLKAVIKTVPTQITALNLLAIDAYKKDQLPTALHFWRQILAIGADQNQDSAALEILRRKVRDLEVSANKNS